MEWQQRIVETATGPITLHEAGPAEGRTAIVLHDEVAVAPGPFETRLAATYRCVAPVLPGFGTADRPDWVESIPDVVEHLMALVDQLDLRDPVAIVGSSLGGWVAAELALRLRHRQPQLVLIGACGLKVPGHPAADHWFAEREDRLQMLYADPANAPEVDLDEYLANEESAARYAWNPRFYDETLGFRIPRLDAPALVVWGGDDAFLSPVHGKAWVEALPDAQLQVLDGCGHFPRYERPDELGDLVTAWLDR